MKKIYVSVDMEGIGGIVSPNQVMKGNGDLYKEGRQLMAEEVNAVIHGINEAGGLAVVGDSHGNMLNIPIASLKGNFLLSCGSDKMLSMMDGIDDSFSGVMFIGYHGRFGTPFAVMDHTYSPSILYSLKINGKEVGEAEINAEVAGYYNVPILMLSGDDTTVKQAKKSFPTIETVEVKKALGRFSAICEPVDIVRQKLKDSSRKAVENIDKYGYLYKSNPPLKIEFVWNSSAMAERSTFVPGVVKIDERITTYECDDYIQAFKVFTVLRTLAYSVADAEYL